MKTKRRYDRIEFNVAVDVESDSLLQKFHAKNLSQGGIFLEVPGKTPQIGTKLKLKFTVPGINKTVTVQGKVIYVHEYKSFEGHQDTKKTGIGIMFEDIPNKDKGLIADYILGKNVSLS